MEADGVTRVVDLHLWAIGPGIYSAIVVGIWLVLAGLGLLLTIRWFH